MYTALIGLIRFRVVETKKTILMNIYDEEMSKINDRRYKNFQNETLTFRISTKLR